MAVAADMRTNGPARPPSPKKLDFTYVTRRSAAPGADNTPPRWL